MRRRLRRERISLAALVLALGFGNAATAGPLEDGQAAYDRGDFATALQNWRPLAEQGVARAQNNLGVLYENGKGVPQNIEEALKWYRLAAEQGYAGAQNNLGLIYALGRSVPQDPLRAYMWLNLASSTLTGDLGKMIASSRDTVAALMSPQQIAEAAEMTRRCRESSYKQCEPSAEAAARLASLQAQDGADTPALATTSHAVTAADYPSQSIRLHESGAVTVTYIVGASGSVTTCSVVLTSGNQRLDDAACAMVRKRWKYKPAMQAGKPVPIQYISKVEFPPR